MRFMLNTDIPNNYAFFEPESRLHVTISNPVDTADRVTSGIKNALLHKTIISLDEHKPAPAVPVEVPVIPAAELPPAGPIPAAEPVAAAIPPVEDTEQADIVSDDEPVTEQTAKKPGRKPKEK